MEIEHIKTRGSHFGLKELDHYFPCYGPVTSFVTEDDHMLQMYLKCIHNVIICIQTCFESKSFTVFSISEQICDGCKDNSKIQDFVSLTNPYCLLDFQI